MATHTHYRLYRNRIVVGEYPEVSLAFEKATLLERFESPEEKLDWRASDDDAQAYFAFGSMTRNGRTEYEIEPFKKRVT